LPLWDGQRERDSKGKLCSGIGRNFFKPLRPGCEFFFFGKWKSVHAGGCSGFLWRWPFAVTSFSFHCPGQVRGVASGIVGVVTAEVIAPIALVDHWLTGFHIGHRQQFATRPVHDNKVGFESSVTADEKIFLKSA
jgi:hypothetical protein